MKASEIIDQIRNNKSGLWLSNGVREVVGQFLSVGVEGQYLRIKTTGGDVYWRLPVKLAKAVWEEIRYEPASPFRFTVNNRAYLPIRRYGSVVHPASV